MLVHAAAVHSLQSAAIDTASDQERKAIKKLSVMRLIDTSASHAGNERWRGAPSIGRLQGIGRDDSIVILIGGGNQASYVTDSVE